MGERILQIGYGAFGAQHARGWAALDLEPMLVIADPSPESRARAAAAHPRARVVADWRAALGDCDVVDAVAPSDVNAALALEALAAGRDVFIEKPVGRDLAEARAVAARARALGRSMQVGFVLRYHPMSQRLRAILDSGALGRLRWIGGEFLCLKRPRRDAGVVLNDAVHFLDLMLWLTGGAPRRVQAAMQDGLGRGFEDLLSTILEWPDGTIGRLDASCVVAGELPDPFAPPGAWSRKRLEIAGEAGRLSAEFGSGELVFRAARHEPDGAGSWRQVVGAPQREIHAESSITPMIAAEFRAFLAARAAGTPPGPGIEAGVQVAAVCEAMFQSARDGRRIEVQA
jgi:predicted dehydrogenase